MYEALIEAFDAAERDPDDRRGLLRGRGGVFTAGNDIVDFLSIAAAGAGPAISPISPPAASSPGSPSSTSRLSPRSTARRSASARRSAFIATSSMRRPTARFQMPFVNLGLVPEAGSSLLAPLRFGRARAAEFLMLAEPFDGEAALDLGFVNALVPADALLAHALGKAAALAAKPRSALLATRRLMRGDPAALKARDGRGERGVRRGARFARGPRRLHGLHGRRKDVSAARPRSAADDPGAC